VLSQKGFLTLIYVGETAVNEEAIDFNDESAKLTRGHASYFSLGALIAAHYCDKGILDCTLRQDSRHVIARSLHRTGAGTIVSNAGLRVDKKAKDAKYYLGGVPEEAAVKVIDPFMD
jgi:hypothetical protein